MSRTWKFTRNGYTRNLPFYEVHHNGKRMVFSGKTKAINYAKSISQDLFNPIRQRIDIVNTQTGECIKYQ